MPASCSAGAAGPARTTIDANALARLHWLALALALIGTGIAAFAVDGTGGDGVSTTTVLVATLARTIGRAALSAFYAITVVRLVHGRVVPSWLRPLERAGRMPLSNYLLQTLLATFLFYGWGLGRWGSVGAASETLIAVVLFAFVQLPLSSWWLARFRYGPIEYVWRRFTYPTSRH